MTRIAIVDDSVTARLFIRRCLEIIGFSEAAFIEAENGKDALTKIRDEHLDLLITDLNMPLMDGETLLKWLKTSPRYCEIPVLVITSTHNAAKEEELLHIGALAVLAKPISPATLLPILQPLIEKQETDHERVEH